MHNKMRQLVRVYCMLSVGVGWVPAVFEDLANTISQSPIAWHGLGSRATAPRARAKSETLSHLRRRVVREKPQSVSRPSEVRERVDRPERACMGIVLGELAAE